MTTVALLLFTSSATPTTIWQNIKMSSPTQIYQGPAWSSINHWQVINVEKVLLKFRFPQLNFINAQRPTLQCLMHLVVSCVVDVFYDALALSVVQIHVLTWWSQEPGFDWVVCLDFGHLLHGNGCHFHHCNRPESGIHMQLQVWRSHDWISTLFSHTRWIGNWSGVSWAACKLTSFMLPCDLGNPWCIQTWNVGKKDTGIICTWKLIYT